MSIQTFRHILSRLATPTIVLTIGIASCGSPVSHPDAARTSPLSKGGGKKSPSTVWESEPNDDPALASDVVGSSDGGGRMGFIATADDNDYYLTYALRPGREMLVHLAMPSAMDFDVQILSRDGTTVLAANHQPAGFSETLRLKNTSSISQTYLLRVFSADGSYSAISPYTLIVGESTK